MNGGDCVAMILVERKGSSCDDAALKILSLKAVAQEEQWALVRYGSAILRYAAERTKRGACRTLVHHLRIG